MVAQPMLVPLVLQLLIDLPVLLLNGADNPDLHTALPTDCPYEICITPSGSPFVDDAMDEVNVPFTYQSHPC